jgi:hypothetical protein
MTRINLHRWFALLAFPIGCSGCTATPRLKPIDPPLVDATTVDRNGTPRHRAPGTLLEDQLTVTLARLSILDTYVARFVEAHSVLPASFIELRSISPEGYDRASVDGWGGLIQYGRDNIRYELRSAGADLVFRTSDDVLLVGAAGRGLPCYIIAGDNKPRLFGADDAACSRIRAAES